ncbi:MAG: hypothetical protein IKN57_05385, partial [Parasporobacterium sp.]|nr:hypothetical protein [Parasporobacterium sp.]
MLKSKWSEFRIYGIYYVLVVLGYTVTLAFSGMRPGIFATLLMLLIIAELLLHRELSVKSLPDILALCFFAYQILSLIWLRAGGFPYSVFFSEFVVSALPMVFYFVGKSAGDASKWYRTYLIAMLILGIPGTILYAWAPQFYNEWSVAFGHISKADAATTQVRMNSVVGSTVLSFLMVAGMLCASYFLGNRKETDKESRKQMMIRRVFAAVCMALCLLFAILANQRSGLVAAFLVIIYVN